MATTCKSLLPAMLLALVGASWLLAADSAPGKPAKPAASFIVHEWGTFTALQDDQGKELPGINVDDEPVPKFVHNLAPFLLNNPILSNDHWLYRQKGAPRQHPLVTVRLETPVLYFYPGKDGTLPKSVDVDVAFRGGWLTEFYPYAKAELPGLQDKNFDFGALTPNTIGRLSWKDVRLDTKQPGPETKDHVWLAPRKVNSVDVSVRNPGGGEVQPRDEHERYLFYRGVANQQAPLRVATDRQKGEIAIRANFDDTLCKTPRTIDAAWLVDIRNDGQAAFRSLPAFEVTGDNDKIAATASRKFSEGDYASGNFKRLKEDMHAALKADGLYDDEATAMLSTWERAYFKTPGMRLFFLVPQVWTDHYLPLTISGAPAVDRVMMGRIELITDQQLALLAKVAAGSPGDPRWIEEVPDGPAKEKFLAGRSDFGDLGGKIPPTYQSYLELGRFRNALMIAEAKRKPSDGLERFIDTYSIRPYKWAK